MRPYQHEHVVTLDETNVVGNVYFAHYLRWQGHCRERFLADHAPVVLKTLNTGELALVTLSCSMQYFAECFALDTITIAMTLHAVNGNRISMDFDFRRGEQLVAQGSQAVACMRRVDDAVRPTPIPDELARALKAFS